MTLHLTMLPAGEGDALHLQWGPDGDRRQLMIDMGIGATGREWRSRMERLPKKERRFELLVVTHVDTDHIYGVLSGLVDAEPIEGVEFDDVWFNGWTQLCGGSVKPLIVPARDAEDVLRSDALTQMFGSSLESYGGRQGEELSIWLRQRPWNRAFGGGPVARPEDAIGPSITLAHGLTLTVLGPTPSQLSTLKPEWRKAVSDALKKRTLDRGDVDPDLVPDGLEPMGRKKPRPPTLASKAALKKLADNRFQSDSTPANGSSIALMAEYEGERILFAGDAHPAQLIDALRAGYPSGPPTLSAFKLPHHGSQNNVSRELVQSVRCQRWLISTSGIKHYHPDAAAIARVLQYGAVADGDMRASLMFNEASSYNGWWNNPRWSDLFGYSAHYGNSTSGLTIEFANGDAHIV